MDISWSNEVWTPVACIVPKVHFIRLVPKEAFGWLARLGGFSLQNTVCICFWRIAVLIPVANGNFSIDVYGAFYRGRYLLGEIPIEWRIHWVFCNGNFSEAEIPTSLGAMAHQKHRMKFLPSFRSWFDRNFRSWSFFWTSETPILTFGWPFQKPGLFSRLHNIWDFRHDNCNWVRLKYWKITSADQVKVNVQLVGSPYCNGAVIGVFTKNQMD